MKIFFYEFKKLIGYRTFLFIITVCLAVEAVSYVQNIHSSDSFPDDYRHIVSAVSNMSYEEKIKYIDNQIEAMNTGTNIYSSQAIYNSKEQLEKINGYGDYLDSIEQKCRNIKNVSLLADKNSFTYKNAEKTWYAYSNIKDKELPFDVSQGVENILIDDISDILILFVLFSTVIFVFAKDKEIGMMNLLHSYPNGRSKLCISKMAVLLVFSFAITMLFMGESVAINSTMYGLGDLTRPIQSVNGFMECSFNFNVWEYLLIAFAFKSLGAFLWSMIFSAICIIALNNVQIYVFSILITGTEAWIYSTIPYSSNIGVLHDINLMTFIKPNNVFSTYRNFNILGTPVNIVSAVSVIWLLLISIALFSIVFAFSHFANREYKKIGIFKIKKHSEKIHGRMYYAFKKSLLMQKNIFIMLFWLIAVIAYHISFSKPVTLTDFYYEKYTTDNAGYITGNVYEVIGNDEQYFLNLEDKMRNGKITADELNKYQSEQHKAEALLQFKTKVNAISSNSNAKIFYDSGYKRVFGIDGNRDFINMLLFIFVFCLLSVSPLIAYDNSIKMNNIIYSTTSGKKSYLKRNMIITLLYCSFASLATLVPYFVNVIKTYGSQGLTCPIQSIENLTAYPLPLNVWQYAVMMLIIRILVITVCGMFMLLISYKSKSRLVSTLINASVFLVPLLILNISKTIN